MKKTKIDEYFLPTQETIKSARGNYNTAYPVVLAYYDDLSNVKYCKIVLLYT